MYEYLEQYQSTYTNFIIRYINGNVVGLEYIKYGSIQNVTINIDYENYMSFFKLKRKEKLKIINSLI